MKKRVLSIFIYALVISASIFPNSYGEEYTLDIDKEYIGIYFPKEFIYELEEKHNYIKAKDNVPPRCLPYVWVTEDSCSTASRQYSETSIMDKERFSNFEFYKEGNDAFVKDENGYIHKRVTTDATFGGFLNYVAQHLYTAVKDLKNVDIAGSNLIIDGKVYHLQWDNGWIQTSDVICQVIDFGIKTNGMSGGLYPLEQLGDMKVWYYSDEEYYHFPLLSYEPLIPLEDMKIEELRLYRNLQFARHGYKFKSPDLQEIFSCFEWYKPGKSNDNIVLTKEETEIVNKCLELEKIKKAQFTKKHPVSFSDEGKHDFLVGEWIDSYPANNSPYGYIFYDDNTFEYVDMTTYNAKNNRFHSCKGEWKINNNNIYIKELSYKRSNSENDISERVVPYPAWVKIGELENCKIIEDDSIYSLILYPIVGFDIYKLYPHKFFSLKLDNRKRLK